MKRALTTLILLLFAPSAAALGSQAGWVATGSFFAPGTGQFINQQPGKGAAHLSTFLGSIAASAYYQNHEDFIEFDDRYDEDNEIIYTTRVNEHADLASRVMLASMFYSSYDAYIERRRLLGNRNYNTPAHAESLQSLTLAPFNREYLTRWTTLAPLAIAASTLLIGPDDGWVTSFEDGMSRGEAAAYVFPQHGAVAIGEEAFFRGMLNNSFSHQWGERWGLAASSVAFGLAHTGEGVSANAAVATAAGFYLGWVHQRNDYQLGESVAIHFWWNVMVSLATLRYGPEDRTAQVSVAIPF
ncbi:hypothetical protein CKO15_12555 [Halorhodospira abdelmalekii]|uniref:CPBP family intramembrane glutamic endopeptidase n=1 Tax=Halorhodospira abdelmalekii TaxID=421629 RepID=UPI001907ADBC|nr:CPBP family intramembrane glutamic endopeptidase [Halorhodospira abdelmalekii]MBK1736086.1 hypothetical protein [Halorhodospira abdelmalekii]